MQLQVDNLLRLYASVRGLLEPIKRSRKAGSTSFQFGNVNELGQAVSNGAAVLGDLVTGVGWLSPYVYWYLPRAYSPYRFETGYAMSKSGDRWATKTSWAPAFLPAGHVPFRRDGKRLAFLYPSNTLGFSLELADSSINPKPPREFECATIDDQPWFYSLDFGHTNWSANPERWVYTHGDTDLSERIILSSSSTGALLPDPTRVREVVQVPETCRPIPVLYPEGMGYLNQHVEITARLVEMDAATLGELSHLGAPLAERVFALFSPHGAHTAPYCLSIEAAPTSISRIPDTTSISTPRPKVTTLLTEFFFEQATTGVPVTFDDDAILYWFIPAIKDCVFTIDRYVFPDRWLGKVYGFDGPIYIYKTGPLELSISPSGALSAYMVADVNRTYGESQQAYLHAVTTFRRRMVDIYRQQHNNDVNVVNTFMTDTGWCIQLGKLLGGLAFDEAVRRHNQYQELQRQIQDAIPQDRSALVAPIISMFTAPVTQDVSAIVGTFDSLRHNADLLPLNKRIFDAIGLPNWSFHDPKDFGTDHLVYASTTPKATVSIQIKSHKEIVEEDDFYDTVLSQRVQSSAYNADLYVILLYGNTNAGQKPPKKPQSKQTEGQIVATRFAELKRKIERTDFRRDTEVVSPETLAQLMLNLGVSASLLPETQVE